MSLIDILHTIKDRRSIHSFKNENVPSDILIDVFSTASYAPTHYMTEPWEIKLYQNAGRKPFVDAIITSYQRIGFIKGDEHPKTTKMIQSLTQFLMEIPHHALIYFEIKEDPIRYEEEYAAVCAFIQNAQLAAWEYGIGMLWTITPYMHDPQFASDIGLANSMKIAAVLQIGYPARISKDKGRTPIKNKLEFINE